MSNNVKLVFRVFHGIEEEYAIFNRILCPSCEKPLVLQQQKMIDCDGRIIGDEFEAVCTNSTCQKKIEIRFYLPANYDPLAKYELNAGSDRQ